MGFKSEPNIDIHDLPEFEEPIVGHQPQKRPASPRETSAIQHGYGAGNGLLHADTVQTRAEATPPGRSITIRDEYAETVRGEEPRQNKPTPLLSSDFGSFERLAFAFGMKIAHLAPSRGRALVDYVEELRGGLENLEGQIDSLTHCLQRYVRPSSSDRVDEAGRKPRVRMNTWVTPKNNLRTTLEVHAYGLDGFPFDPRTNAWPPHRNKTVFLVNRADELLDAKSDLLCEYGSDLIGMLLAAHRRAILLIEARFHCEIVHEPVGMRDDSGRLFLGVERSNIIRPRVKAMELIPDLDVANSTLAAFEATFPSIRPWDFVGLQRYYVDEVWERKDAVLHLAEMGVLPNDRADRARAVVRGSRRFPLSSEDVEGAAALVERALDLVDPGWKARYDFRKSEIARDWVIGGPSPQ